MAPNRNKTNLAQLNPRPTALKEIADQSDTIEDFGRHLRNWLHELPRVFKRRHAEAVIVEDHIFDEGSTPGPRMLARIQSPPAF